MYAQIYVRCQVTTFKLVGNVSKKLSQFNSQYGHFPEEHMLCQGISYDTSHGKGKSPGAPFHGVISKHRQFKKFEFVRPFRKATQKTQSCFALDTEKGYWPVTVQPLYRVKKIVIASNVLPLSPSQTSSSQNSNVDSYLQYYL